jgi:mannose-6-phosphate isomerase class I
MCLDGVRPTGKITSNDIFRDDGEAATLNETSNTSNKMMIAENSTLDQSADGKNTSSNADSEPHHKKDLLYAATDVKQEIKKENTVTDVKQESKTENAAIHVKQEIANTKTEYEHLFEIITNPQFTNDFQKLSSYLIDEGIDRADDLMYLDPENIHAIANMLKNVKRNRFLKFYSSK